MVGDTRYKAALKLGLDEVPVHVATGLTPAQFKAYRIADNKTAELADWDYELLVQESPDLQQTDFDLDLLGFSPRGVEDHILALGLARRTNRSRRDPATAGRADDPTGRSCGFWGSIACLCGDSSQARGRRPAAGWRAIHLVNTDPPYNVRVEPRSNNAIAAGLSSFTAPPITSKLNVARHPEKPNGQPRRSCVRKTGRWPTTSCSDQQFDRLSASLVRQPGAGARCPGRSFYIWGGYANCGNYPPVSEGLRPVFLAGDHLGKGASGADPQGLHGQP